MYEWIISSAISHRMASASTHPPQAMQSIHPAMRRYAWVMVLMYAPPTMASAEYSAVSVT